VLTFLEFNSSHDLVSGLVDKAFQLQNLVFARLGWPGRQPVFVGRDVRIQIHPSFLGPDALLPGVGDRIWGRAFLVRAEKAGFRCEFEFRLIARADRESGMDRDITGRGEGEEAGVAVGCWVYRECGSTFEFLGRWTVH
jgi:hypothetical protein